MFVVLVVVGSLLAVARVSARAHSGNIIATNSCGISSIDRIKKLPFQQDLEYPCDYRNIRELTTLSFMDHNPQQMDRVQYSKNDEKVFFQCREVALKLAEELGKAYLPTV